MENRIKPSVSIHPMSQIYKRLKCVALITITHFVGLQKNEMLLEIADDLPNIEADKLKLKLACGQRKMIPS